MRGEEVVKSDIQHTHAPDPARAELLKVKSGNKRRAVDTLETPQQILGAAVGGLTEGNDKLLHVFCYIFSTNVTVKYIQLFD